MEDATKKNNKQNTNEKNSHSRFRQQSLPAWQPILRIDTGYKMFMILSVIFTPIGVALLIISNNVTEFTYDYTYCKEADSPENTCADFVKDSNKTDQTCYCIIEVELQFFKAPVYIYYGLSRYYQNHRRYVPSRDDRQLSGKDIPPEELKSECEPYRVVTINGTLYGYAPCGGIANSLFNDSFTIVFGNNTVVELINTGIAWEADKKVKYKNPKSWKGYIKPKDWVKPVWELDPLNPDNNGYQNEDLMVWMRPAPLPRFRKLFRRVNHANPPFAKGLPAGNYYFEIEYRYPVTSFDGTKMIIISTTSIFGGKNAFLGIAYIVFGCSSFVCAVIFYIIYKQAARRKKILDQELAKVIKLYV